MSAKFDIKISRFFILPMIGILLVLSACNTAAEDVTSPTPIPVVEYKNETSFDTVYPVDWVETILTQGFLIFSPVNVAYQGEIGPSVTVRMIAPGFSSSPQLEEDFNNFLTRGPFQGDYEQTSEILNVKLGQYSGLRVFVERQQAGEIIAMKGMITAVFTQNGTSYYFIATAPIEQWDQNWPKMQAILQNVKFYD